MKKLGEYEIMPLVPMAPVADPQMSPDGARVLFTHSEVNMEEDKYDTQIWLLELKKKKPVQFTFGKENSSNPRWSHDGKRILFTSNRPSQDDPKAEDEKKKKAQIFVIPADGGEAKQITQIEEGVQNPAWSPDSKNILFRANVFKGEKAPEKSRSEQILEEQTAKEKEAKPEAEKPEEKKAEEKPKEKPEAKKEKGKE